MKNSECVTPKISRIFPLEIKVGEEVTVMGENFNDSKFGDLNLYVGFTKVNLFDISRWQDDKIIFEIGDYLESGYIALRGTEVNTRGPYLEILEPEEDVIPIYTFKPKQEPEQESESDLPQQERIQTEEQQEPLESQSAEGVQAGESKPSEIQEPQGEEQQEASGQQEQEQKQDQEKPHLTFLASIFYAIKNFFMQFFR